MSWIEEPGTLLLSPLLSTWPGFLQENPDSGPENQGTTQLEGALTA